MRKKYWVKLRVGSGKMPSFASIIAGKEEAIISFLFDKDSRDQPGKSIF
jgi:hypothetical protein